MTSLGARATDAGSRGRPTRRDTLVGPMSIPSIPSRFSPETTMNEFTIEVGAAYLNQSGGLIRVVQKIEDGDVRWRDFGADDGMPIGDGLCSLSYFKRWASRRLTEEEQSKLRWDLARVQDQMFLRGLLERIPDELLLQEVKHRGLTPS